MKTRTLSDELYIAIVLALPDEAILGLPKDISLEELIQRFPSIYEEVTRQQSAAHTVEGETTTDS